MSLIFLFLGVIIGLLGYIVWLMRKVLVLFNMEGVVEGDVELSEEEMAVLARQEEFDRRINRMRKEVEVYKASLYNPSTGNIAEELEVGVKNLPHGDVKGYFDLYNEYAE